MKLFYSPGACSMSCHIALETSKLPYEAINVGRNADEETKKAYASINPLGAVPALQLDDKHVITQNIAILEYIADQKPATKLLAAAGTVERADTMKWLSLVGSDLHPAFAPLFGMARITNDPSVEEAIKKWAHSAINKYLTLINNQLQGKPYLVGDHLTIADCYFYTVFQWTNHIGLATDQFKEITRYCNDIAKLPAVAAVREKESENKVH